ncbi:Protein of unknown function [Actinobaculum suis]|uniref:DUF3046 domain-containing protein n=1 Tax=Actinobaculum suis TaxID=1657 RepID=A0A0K9EVT3_9ACTO|nr:DUF3046 domain-containing protein [Actinobaculum suis]KMY24086.1 hypothetical protein ACU19_00350 [Actinobaculum suis]MDY5153903.1 DUF3046 domain-containing protein [Actinobaculum suis]OCA96307.1 hypothetical protein ACU20_00045 [Actinobaculum suis]OCA96345.1 hypothetical protein ACU21_00045 [Actinobaculum suis]SDE00768.1 Protein of unknown function [Actinobaculum suis]
MRESEFWANLEWVFGDRGHSVAQDMVLSALDGRSLAEAVEDGVEPQKVWDALCENMGFPEKYRYLHRIKPNERGLPPH